MTAYPAVLIYDGDCPFCSAAATALRRIPGAGTVPWSSDHAQAFLAAQFEEVPFALVFADREADRVWIGRDAAREICGRAGMPVLVRDIVDDNYESLADAIRTVTGVDGEPDPYHGTYPLAPEAASALEALSDEARNVTEHLV